MCRDVFLTALLMAEPREIAQPMPQISIRNLELTGYIIPSGWYGFVPAAGIGILHRAGVLDTELGLDGLERLGAPELSSRSKEYDGRRLVRVDGGFVILNFMNYRERDHTAAARSKRYRARLEASRKQNVTSRRSVVSSASPLKEKEKKVVQRKERESTPLEAEAEAEAERNVTKNSGGGNDKPKERPKFQGERFAVFQWQEDELTRILGRNANEFNLPEWYFTLDKRAAASSEVIPREGVWVWLQARTLTEARARGLPIADTRSPREVKHARL